MTRHLVAIFAAAHLLLQGSTIAQGSFSSRVVVSGLSAPWEILVGPDDYLWITERTGRRLIRVNRTSGAVVPALDLASDSYDPGDSWHEGLLGLALHPDLLKNAGRDYIYVAFTYDADSGPQLSRRLKVRRYTYDAAKQTLVAPTDLLTNLPAHDDHGGGRLVFGPDQKLYLTRGDSGGNWLVNYCTPIRSQDLPTDAQIAGRDWSTYEGKILRLDLDGNIPADNPLLNGVRSHVFSYGHRNPQGLGFGPNGVLYASEHGPGTDDELNVIVAGSNYGWPFVAGYRDDRGYVYANWSQSSGVPCASLKFEESGEDAPPSVPRVLESQWPGTFVPPIRTFFTIGDKYDFQKSGSATIAAGGLEVYSAPPPSGLPGWATSVLQTGMTMGRVYRVKLSDDGRSAVGTDEELFRTANRYRDIAVGRDHRTFYLVTDNNGLGRTTDPSGASVRVFANPGSVLEFKYLP
jgi:PQQ-dependent dehydrogenase (s-GDH family)